MATENRTDGALPGIPGEAHPPAAGMTPRLTALFAVAGGAAVGSLYYVQPLLELISRDLHTGPTAVGLLVTLTQVGYALGILLIVPLGDLHPRRTLIPVMMTLSAVALLACAAAPGIVVLAVASAGLGATTVAGQLLTPLAGDLADPDQRGRIVGLVVSGLITGILVARVASGLLASVGGWRTVFLVAAGLAVVLAVLLRTAIPRTTSRATAMSYGRLLRSMVGLVGRYRTLRVTLVLGASSFGVFTMFWTALTFLLSAPPYSYPTWAIGLFGIVGLVGALAAQRAGRAHDRGWSVRTTVVAWALVALAWVVGLVGGHVLVVLLVGVLVLDVGVQTVNILNQSRAFSLDPDARSRLNTAVVVGNFVGGAIGSVVATTLWQTGGWSAVCLVGIAVSLACLALCGLTARGALVPASP